MVLLILLMFFILFVFFSPCYRRCLKGGVVLVKGLVDGCDSVEVLGGRSWLQDGTLIVAALALLPLRVSLSKQIPTPMVLPPDRVGLVTHFCSSLPGALLRVRVVVAPVLSRPQLVAARNLILTALPPSFLL